MSNITLSASLRSNLLSLQNTSSVLNATTSRLSTGSKVSNPTSYFQANSLSDSATELAMRKDAIGQGISAMTSGTTDASAISSELRELKTQTADISRAVETYKKGDSVTSLKNNLKSYQAFCENAQDRIDGMASGSSILAGGKISIALDNNGTSTFEIDGADITSRGLKLQTDAAGDQSIANEDKPLVDQNLSELADKLTGENDEETLGQISKVLNAKSSAIESATNTVNGFVQSMGKGIATLEARYDFMDKYKDTQNSGEGKLALADLNEEGANLVALQTRQQLGIQALSFAGQSEQQVLRLFG